MESNSPVAYFSSLIAMLSSMMPAEYQLTDKEREFLAHCCALNYAWGSLNDFTLLERYFVDEHRILRTRADCSVYKNKLAVKKWINSGRGLFQLPKELDIKWPQKLEYAFTIACNDDNSRRFVQEVQGSNGAGPDLSAIGR